MFQFFISGNDEFESQIDGSTAEGKLLKERVAEIRERFQEMDPDTADYQALLQALSKELAGAKESAQKIKEAMDLRAKNVSKLSKEDQDYINNFQKNETGFTTFTWI